MITNGMKNRIILINNERIFYRNNGYTIFPPNGSLDILDDLLPLHKIVKMPKPFRTTAGMEVREILRIPIPAMSTKLRRLSPRQKLVFKLLLTELTNEQIAEELYIALSTLKNHVSNIYKILELTSRTGLIKKYGYLLAELEQVQLAENQ
jgi:DNA-binding CsgD family transcriptional regulator